MVMSGSVAAWYSRPCGGWTVASRTSHAHLLVSEGDGVAIGPDSRNMASGRVVVIAVLDGALGVMAIVGGIGPQVTSSEPPVREVGLLGIAMGLALVAAGITLALRTPFARTCGAVGGIVATLLGFLVVGLSLASFGECAPANGGACELVVGGIAVVGGAIAAFGVASTRVVSGAPAAAFRRDRKR